MWSPGAQWAQTGRQTLNLTTSSRSHLHLRFGLLSNIQAGTYKKVKLAQTLAVDIVLLCWYECQSKMLCEVTVAVWSQKQRSEHVCVNTVDEIMYSIPIKGTYTKPCSWCYCSPQCGWKMFWFIQMQMVWLENRWQDFSVYVHTNTYEPVWWRAVHRAAVLFTCQVDGVERSRPALRQLGHHVFVKWSSELVTSAASCVRVWEFIGSWCVFGCTVERWEV